MTKMILVPTATFLYQTATSWNYTHANRTPETSVLHSHHCFRRRLVLGFSERPCCSGPFVAAAALWFFQAPPLALHHSGVLAVIFNIPPLAHLGHLVADENWLPA